MPKIRRKHTEIKDGMSQINLTPMLDLMFVLLIVFIVAIPVMLSSVKINLPTLNTESVQLDENISYFTISIDQNNNLFINDVQTSEANIAQDLQKIALEKAGEKKFFIKADKSIQYGYLIKIMSVLNDAGFKEIALLTKIEKPQQNNISDGEASN
jgi:biopolymer transport protein TolR